MNLETEKKFAESPVFRSPEHILISFIYPFVQ